MLWKTCIPCFKSEAAGHLQMFFKIGVIKNLADFTNKILYPMLESLFSKVAGLNRCFPKKLAKFLRTPFSTEHL